MIRSDAVLKLSKAVSVAENSPKAWNNPGSLKMGDVGKYPTCGFGNSEGVVKFVNAIDGWNALYDKIDNMLAGRSKVYHLTDTLEQVGIKYSGGKPEWAVNVAAFLGCPLMTTLQQLSE